MALQPQEIEIPLNLGMATKPSEELQDASSMRLVQNLHWRGMGEIEKAPAVDVDHEIAAPSGGLYAVGTPCGLVTRDNHPVVVTGNYGAQTYNESLTQAQWARGVLPLASSVDGRVKFAPVSYDVSRAFVESSNFAKDNSGILQVAAAQYAGVQVVAWVTEGASRVLRMKAYDVDTGQTVAHTEWVTTNAGTVNISACAYSSVAGQEGVLIAYCDAASLTPFDINAIRYDHGTKQFVDAGTLTNNASGSGRARFLVKSKSDGTFFLAYRSNTTSQLVVQNRSISTIISTHAGTHDFSDGIDIVEGPTRTLIVSTLTTDLYAEVFGTPGSYITVNTTGTDTWYGCTAALETRSGSTDDAVVWVNGTTGSSPVASYVLSHEVNFSATTPTTSSREKVVPHAWCVSRGFTLQARAHVAMALGFYQAATNSARTGVSCVVARYNANVGGADYIRHDPVAKLCHDRFFVRTDVQNLDIFASTCTDSNDNAWIALPADASAVTYDYGGSDYYYPQSIFVSRLNASLPMPVPYASPEPGVVAVAGGFPWQFDGDTPSELAPVMRPLVSVDAASGAGETGTFSVIGVWNWVDAKGRLHRIASEAVSTGAITDNQIDVYVSCPPFTAFDGWTGKWLDVEVYITTNAGTEYRRARTSTGGKQYHSSVPTGDVWFKFTDVDPDLGVSGDTLAIFSTEIEPEPVPAFVHISKIADRMWAVDAEDRSRIWYSKPMVAGFGVEWSTTCTLVIGDEATAVVDVGGFPTVLARGGIYQIAGAGPDATGSGSFAPAQKMPFEVDCVDPVSVCRTPLGVVFRGRRGLHLLGNGLSDAPGLLIDSEMLTDPTVDPSVSASYRLRVVYQEQTSEIQCVTPAGKRLVYSTLEQKWAKYSTSPDETKDMAIARGRHWRLDSVTEYNLRSEKLYSDVGSSYNSDSTTSWRIDTPWYKFDDVAGHVRLWRVWLALKLASDPSDSSVSITYYTDWSESAGQTVTWSGSDLNTLSSAGDAVVRLPFVPAKQACGAFKMSITCTPTGATSSPKPLALRMQVGARPSKGKRIKGSVKR